MSDRDASREAEDATGGHGEPAGLMAAAISDPAFQARYEIDSLLGAGGMGEVALARDRRLQREVALKVLRASAREDRDLTRRFQREALLQARLDHPAIVPVYDYECTDDRLYFTMKRVRGRTLRSVIDAIAAGDEATRTEWGRGRLLAAFVQVCRAIDYAHSRGALHRDLKPQNVMLGEFGEVHVLEWGIAKIGEGTASDPGEGSAVTVAGETLGTLGYMPPEQIVGEELTPASDVFALGAILFEILGGGPLVPPGTRSERATATLKGVEPRVRERSAALGLPPELEAVVLRATLGKPKARFGSARELADAVQRYLEGDRDSQRRRELADELVQKSERMLAIEDERARARIRPTVVKQLARALALHPEHERAGAVLGRLLLEPPPEVPPEAREIVERAQADSEREAARAGFFRYLIWIALIPWYASMGVNDWPLFWVTATLTLASAAVMGLIWKGKLPTRSGVVAFATSTVVLMLMTRAFSPLTVAAAIAGTNVMFYAGYFAPRARVTVVLLTLLSIAAPFVAEHLGWVAPTFEVTREQIRVIPRLLDFDPQGTFVFFVVLSVLGAATPALAAGRVRDALTRAQERLAVTAWQLGELVPRAGERAR